MLRRLLVLCALCFSDSSDMAWSDELVAQGIPQPTDADVSGPVFKWTAPLPTENGTRGYPKLPGVEVIPLTRGRFGELNHHPILQRIDDAFYVMHTHHPGHHESFAGRNVGGWVGDSEGKHWTGPLELFPPMCKVENKLAFEEQRVMFGCKFHQTRDGQIYALGRVGYKSWPNGYGGNKQAMHHHTGFVARTISPQAKLGPVFWIELGQDVSADPYMKDIPNQSANPIAAELRAASPWDNVRGGSLSPEGIREPRPYRRRASSEPNTQSVAETETAYLTGPAFATEGDVPLAACLTRTVPNNNGDPYLWIAYSRDRGETWGPFRRTEIPSAYNRSAIGQLPDGRVYIIGSLAPAGQADRRPLAIALSKDGVHFDKVYRLLEERIHTIRHDLIYDGFIWIATSYGRDGRKEVAVVKIPIASLR